MSKPILLLHRPRSNVIPLHGKIKNFNTIEEFRSPELKKELFNDVVRQLIQSFTNKDGSSIATFNPFLIVSFADLKKYVYHYWFAFPALIQKPAWELVTNGDAQEEAVDTGLENWDGDVSHILILTSWHLMLISSAIQFQAEGIRRMKQEAKITAEAFLYRSSAESAGETTSCVAPVEQWWTFFEGVSEEEVKIAYTCSILY